LAAAEEVSDDLDLRLAAALAATEEASSLEAFLREQIAALQGDVAARDGDLNEALARVTALEATLARTQTDRMALQEQLREAMSENASAQLLVEERSALQGQLEEARSQAGEDRALIGELERRIAVLEAQIVQAAQDREAESAAAADELAALKARLEQLIAERQADQAAAAEEVASLKDRLAAALSTQDEAAVDRDELRRRLAAALAAKLDAERSLETTMSEAEQRAALLSQANRELDAEKSVSAEAQRQTALLNQQVAEMRSQLSRLQALLDDYKARDEANQVQIQSLGSDLNQALAQKAAEERRRRQLEEAERKRLEVERDQLEKYRSEFFGQLREVFAGREGVKIVGDRFVFSSEVLFAPGSADLSDAGRGQITSITATLRELADEIPGSIDWVLRVDGHTDDVPLSGQGQYADNWELSQARALSVVRYMTDFLGFPPARLAANGFGQYQPIAAGTSSEARAANRRIELKFTER
jgi:chemotaxis protein MotB